MRHIKWMNVEYVDSEEYESYYYLSLKIQTDDGFVGFTTIDIVAEDYIKMILDLKKLYRSLNGSFEYRHWTEEFLTIQSTDARKGHFCVLGRLGRNLEMFEDSTYQYLTFKFDIDQTDLKEFIDELRRNVAY